MRFEEAVYLGTFEDMLDNHRLDVSIPPELVIIHFCVILKKEHV
jgi:hypothetical protein